MAQNMIDAKSIQQVTGFMSRRERCWCCCILVALLLLLLL